MIKAFQNKNKQQEKIYSEIYCLHLIPFFTPLLALSETLWKLCGCQMKICLQCFDVNCFSNRTKKYSIYLFHRKFFFFYFEKKKCSVYIKAFVWSIADFFLFLRICTEYKECVGNISNVSKKGRWNNNFLVGVFLQN